MNNAHPIKTSKPTDDSYFAQRAIDLAERGRGLVSPGPLVGCAIVSAAGEIVGEGTYIYDQVKHAEVVALEAAGERAAGSTAYISLEPHAHHGKTPPCTDALISAGIRRVVAPIEDPNPLVSGSGFRKLREAGIEVVTGVLAEQAARLNEKFCVWHRKNRPFVHLKLALSLDGRISLDRTVSTALSGTSARDRVQRLRHECDAILVGSGTAVADNPQLTDRSGLPRRRPLVRVVLDRRLRINARSHLVTTAGDSPTLVFTSQIPNRDCSALTRFGAEVVPIDADRDFLSRVLDELRRREIQSVLVEGGSEIAGAFLDARLVDKITLIYAPLVVGGSNAPNAFGGIGASSIETAAKIGNVQFSQLGEDFEMTGYPIFD